MEAKNGSAMIRLKLDVSSESIAQMKKLLVAETKRHLGVEKEFNSKTSELKKKVSKYEKDLCDLQVKFEKASYVVTKVDLEREKTAIEVQRNILKQDAITEGSHKRALLQVQVKEQQKKKDKDAKSQRFNEFIPMG